MTKKETTEILSAMMLAFPSAEMFKGGMDKLKPTAELWSTCLFDVDFWTAQQALVRICRESKFPPTIAEFRTQVENVRRDIREQSCDCIFQIRAAKSRGQSIEAFYGNLPETSTLKHAIDLMGGPDGLIATSDQDGDAIRMWNWDEFERCYESALRGERNRALNPGKDGESHGLV